MKEMIPKCDMQFSECYKYVYFICSLFNDTVSNSGYNSITIIVSNEVEGMWKEAVVT